MVRSSSFLLAVSKFLTVWMRASRVFSSFLMLSSISLIALLKFLLARSELIAKLPFHLSMRSSKSVMSMFWARTRASSDLYCIAFIVALRRIVINGMKNCGRMTYILGNPD